MDTLKFLSTMTVDEFKSEQGIDKIAKSNCIIVDN